MTKYYPERDPSGPEGDRTTRYATMDSTRLARPEGCCDMHTPMSVRSMGLTSSGHPRPDRVARLDHYAIGDYASSHSSGRMPRDAPPAAGPIWPAGHRRAAGAAGRRLHSSHRLPDPIGPGSREWSEGGARHRSGQADVGVTSDMLY